VASHPASAFLQLVTINTIKVCAKIQSGSMESFR